MTRPRHSAAAAAFAAGLAVAVFAADAAPIVYGGSQGSLAASASFEVSGTHLIVTLTNTSTNDVTAPGGVLTGVGFDLAGNPTLSGISVLLNTGSTVFYDPQGQPPSGIVGGEWGYKSGISFHGAAQGISSTGLGIFGPGNRFPGANLSGNSNGSLAGVDYGLLSAGDNTATGNTGLTGSGGLIKNSVVFTFGNLPADFDPYTEISHVVFQYGSDLDEGHFAGLCTANCDPLPAPLLSPSVPEPGTLVLLGSALAGFWLLRRRQRS